MAERDDSEKANGDVPEVPAGASGEPPSVSEIKSAPLSTLPAVDSPPLMPDENPERQTPTTAEATESAAPAVEPPSAEDKPQTSDEAVAAPAPRKFSRFSLSRRQRRNALRAATIAFALFAGAGYGVIFGGSFATKEQPKPQPDTAAIAERKALQQQIAALSKQVAALKTDLDRANKSTQTKIAKITGRLDSPPPATAAQAPAPAQPVIPETTGSIPQTKAAVVDVPLPRPAPQTAAPTNGRTVVQGWSIRDVIDGYIYVQNRGEIFEVVPGVPLPGLGRVRSVRREDGRWIVETPRGIIVAQRDRRHFE